jgi:organic hydroperoxide reductase OsmC/OhrA
MAIYTAEIVWSRSDQKFIDNRYSRKHILRFDGGIEIAGSSSPYVVPLPYSAVDAVDPEEAFVASLSSCHMLWFLSIAEKPIAESIACVLQKYRVALQAGNF